MTDWEQHWQDQETPWDKGAAAPPLVEFLGGPHGGLLQQGRVLVPGCGSGHDVREIARHGPEVTGLDLSPTAIATARRIPTPDRVHFATGNLFEWQAPPFDAAWEHTCFCAINPDKRPDYGRAMASLIRPAGHLVGLFFIDPWGDETPDPPPFGAAREDIIESLQPWFELVGETQPKIGFEGRVGGEWLAIFSRTQLDHGVASDPATR